MKTCSPWELQKKRCLKMKPGPSNLFDPNYGCCRVDGCPRTLMLTNDISIWTHWAQCSDEGAGKTSSRQSFLWLVNTRTLDFHFEFFFFFVRVQALGSEIKNPANLFQIAKKKKMIESPERGRWRQWWEGAGRSSRVQKTGWYFGVTYLNNASFFFSSSSFGFFS